MSTRVRSSPTAVNVTSTSLRFCGVGLDLPVRADVPAEHEPVRGFVGQDGRPRALAAVGSGEDGPPCRVSQRSPAFKHVSIH